MARCGSRGPRHTKWRQAKVNRHELSNRGQQPEEGSPTDPRQRILAYSTVPGQPVDEDRRQGILGLRVPGSLENAHQVRLVCAAHEPVRLPPLTGDDLPRLACPVRPGGETLGSIWVVDSGTLAADAEATLAQGASTAALLLLRLRAAQELTQHQTPTCCAGCWRARRTPRRQFSGWAGTRSGWPRSRSPAHEKTTEPSAAIAPAAVMMTGR